ncbi:MULTISPECIES: nucleoside diphosphate kinase regulator [Alteromonadaceae]|uniref:nucleoside diphosphate kinase regulator n=1 Tax=Alteromonadaceae TaxID=72275 RepID=UPI001C084357|nr:MULTISPECIES: nucleoside diphosphate kinase regulator [Aliiglaciecola]MBU2879017.1 nucleoside diphosphate kinase regulator [Aliiglaciecola lipolytica]MDO6710715.1 nucleoside diphosphate kinase regulator [Aliiglaciecola sp. 2_MG-2023]MDO6751877.1 nucleoside diphosphate kinase regulator [Aliiglaciecola sp. 1_MG-2023]
MQNKPEIFISTSDLAMLEEQLEASKLPEELVAALEDELARATVIDGKNMPEDVVTIGKQVTFKILDSDKLFTKTLCLPADTAKHADSISVFAPIGSALLGLRAGQSIDWQTQRGQQSVQIVQVNTGSS